ncbi:peptidylprolyl isomerase [Halanaerobaculum tunisiense]
MLNFFRRNTKIIAAIVAVLFVAGSALVYLNTSGNQQANQAKASNRPVATVNGEDINYQEFNSQLSQVMQQYQRSQGQVSADRILPLKSRVLKGAVERELLNQRAAEEGFKERITDEEVQTELDNYIEQMMQQASVSSEEELDKLLKKRGRSLADFKERVKGRVKEVLALRKLQNKITGDVEVSESEIKEQYEKITASHILFKTNNNQTAEEAKAKAEKVLAKVKEGQDFAQLAKEYSEGPSADKGGQLGSFGRGKMLPSFEEKAFSLEVGEVSEPVKTKSGYHLIKVTDKQEAEGEEFEKKKKDIKQKLLQKKQKKVFSNWLEDAKEEAEITIHEQEIKAYKAYQDKNYQQAISGYKAALENKQESASYLYNNLAQAYQKQDKTDQAIETYKTAMEKYPKQVTFHKNLAGLYQKTDQPEKAIDVYETALAKEESDAQLHFNLANLYRKLDKKDKALEQYDKFSELSGDNLMAHYRLYTIYQKMGLTEKAKQEKKKVQELQKKKQQQQKKKQQQIKQQQQNQQ